MRRNPRRCVNGSPRRTGSASTVLRTALLLRNFHPTRASRAGEGPVRLRIS